MSCGGLELPLQPADNATSTMAAATQAAVPGVTHMRPLSFPDRPLVVVVAGFDDIAVHQAHMVDGVAGAAGDVRLRLGAAGLLERRQVNDRVVGDPNTGERRFAGPEFVESHGSEADD